MPDTARWLAWLAMERQSDAVLVQLATMAAAAVLIWESMRRLPEWWRERARTVYLWALFAVALMMGGSMGATIYDWAMYVAAGAFILACLVLGKAQQNRDDADAEMAKPTTRLSIAERKIEREET